MLFGDPCHKHLPVDRQPSKMSVETLGTGGKLDDRPPLPDMPCLFDPDRPDLPPPVLSAGSEMDGQ